MDEKITLDKETFRALSADTRIKILKTLNNRRHTQSELSAGLNLSVPTVKEHLDALEKAALVKLIDEGHKWKYYELTEKGRCVLDPDRKKIWIVVSLLILSLASGIIVILSRFFIGFQREIPVQRAMIAEKADTVFVSEAATYKFPYFEIFIFIFVLMLVFILIYYLRKGYLGKYLKKK